MKSTWRGKWPAILALGAMLSWQAAAPLGLAIAQGSNDDATITPIKHVIVVIGENHTFNNIFATYRPKNGEWIGNLLSRKIVNQDGSPGANSAFAAQYQVNSPLPSTYFVSVDASSKTPYSPLPTPQLNGAPDAQTSLAEIEANPTGVQPPFDDSVTFTQLQLIEPSLEPPLLQLLGTGATGAAGTTGDDDRVTNASNLPNTVFQWTGPISLMIRITATRSIGSSTCGNSPTALWPMQRPPIHQAV